MVQPDAPEPSPEPCARLLARPLAEVLAAVGCELDDLAAVGGRLQTCLSDALVAAACDPSHLRDIQGFDLLVQRLEGLARFVCELSARASPDWNTDAHSAARHVRLSDLSGRLARSGGDADGRAPRGEGDGEVEMF